MDCLNSLHLKRIQEHLKNPRPQPDWSDNSLASTPELATASGETSLPLSELPISATVQKTTCDKSPTTGRVAHIGPVPRPPNTQVWRQSIECLAQWDRGRVDWDMVQLCVRHARRGSAWPKRRLAPMHRT